MALTVEQLGRTNVTGNRLTVALKVTFDDSYPTNGETLDRDWETILFNIYFFNHS